MNKENEDEGEVSFTHDEWEISKFILGKPKRKELLEKLSETRMYFNQLCREVSGSRTTIADALEDLIQKDIISFEWQVLEEEGPVYNPARYKAVKMFFIKENYIETVNKLFV